MNETTSALTLLEEPTSSTLQILLPKKKHLHIRKGEAPFTSDDTLKNFYFIINGKIKISQINFETGKELTTSLLTRGDMFDVITLLDAKEHECLASALEESDIVEVPIESVRRLLKEDQSFNRLFLPYLAQQMRDYEDLAVDISLYDVYERLIRLFARYAKRNNSKKSIAPINTLSHEELATLIGSVRKVVNRNLQKLKKEDIITLSRQHIELKDLDRLLEKLQ